jgi:hypothetical protein
MRKPSLLLCFSGKEEEGREIRLGRSTTRLSCYAVQVKRRSGGR